MHRKYFSIRRIGCSIRFLIMEEEQVCESMYLTNEMAKDLASDLLDVIQTK